MKISAAKVKHLCDRKQLRIKQLLSEAGVSRNAYYSLVRKGSILPRSVAAIAARLDVSPAAFLEDTRSSRLNTRQILETVDALCATHKKADRDNIRHTLILLQEQPLERLRRALIRGQPFNLQQKRTGVSKGIDKAER